MAANQLLLTGVPAFVGQVLGPTRVKFSLDENEFDPANMIEVDLAKNTSAGQPSAWGTNVDVDHQTVGGLTTIGPRFHAGPHVGGVYLSERLVAQYAAVLASWPPAPDAIYQYQLLLRATNGGIKRYHGFKAHVLSAGVGSLVHVGFVRIGTAAPQLPGRWIDLADPAVCDPPANGFTTIAPSTPAGSVGAVFLSSDVIALDGPNYPKYPKYMGW
jgi:hypothetical protein